MYDYNRHMSAGLFYREVVTLIVCVRQLLKMAAIYAFKFQTKFSEPVIENKGLLSSSSGITSNSTYSDKMSL